MIGGGRLGICGGIQQYCSSPHISPSVEGADPSQQTRPGIVEEKQIKTRFNFHPH